MQIKIKNVKLVLLIILFLETTILVFTYFVPRIFVDFAYTFHLMFGEGLLFIFVNSLYVVSVMNKLKRIRRIADLKSAQIIGNDVQEAYYFGEIGLVVTDKNDIVLWNNEFLTDRNLPLIDNNLLTWRSDLKLLQSGDDITVKIEFDNHIYEVKFIKEASLYIFKDVTEFEKIVQYSRDQSPVVGIICFDNYSDLQSTLDETKLNDMTSVGKKSVLDYAKKFNLLLRRFKDDSYLFVTMMEKYDEMLADKFSLVNDIRQATMSDDNETSLTLSLGIGFNFPDYSKLNDLASNALDVALSRGGDQVVIAPYGDNMIFLGGKTDARTHRNRVKVRTLSQSFMSIMDQASNIFIMGHTDLDMDSLGGALGIMAMAHHLNKKAYIIYDEQKFEKKTRKAFKLIFNKSEITEMTASIKAANEMIDDSTLLIVVDVSDPTRVLAPSFLQNVKNIAVIDHHRRGDSFIESSVFSYIEASASSVSELVTEMVRYNQVRIVLSDKYATFLLAGILLDTNYYRNKTGARTYDASMILKEFGANNSMADEFLKEDYEEYSLKNKILSNSYTPYYGVVVALSDDSDIIDMTMLASVATELLGIKGVNASFVIGRTGEKEVRISTRSDGSVNCQLLCEKLGGGGHFTAAATSIANTTVEKVSEDLKAMLEIYLAEARVVPGK